MSQPVEQILTVAGMRAAEEALIAQGSSVEALMDMAGRGAAEWVWRVAGRHPVPPERRVGYAEAARRVEH